MVFLYTLCFKFYPLSISENQLTFGKVIAENKVPHFFQTQCSIIACICKLVSE